MTEGPGPPTFTISESSSHTHHQQHDSSNNSTNSTTTDSGSGGSQSPAGVSTAPTFAHLVDRFQYAAGDDLESKVARIVKVLQGRDLYWAIKKALKDELMSSSSTIDRLDVAVPRFLESSGLATQLRNSVYWLDREARINQSLLGTRPSNVCHLAFGQNSVAAVPPVPLLPEPLELVDEARRLWDDRLRYQVRSVAAQQKRPLLRKRGGQSDSVDDEAFLPMRYVFASEDLLEALTAIVNPNQAAQATRLLGWGLCKVALKTPGLASLRRKYAELRPDVRHIGVDDDMPRSDWFVEAQFAKCSEAVAQGSPPHLRKLARTGLPNSCRPKVWRHVFGVGQSKDNKNSLQSQHQRALFRSLVGQVEKWELITDDLFRLDVEETTDDEDYFVFEEMLDEMILAFSRDSCVASMCCLSPTTAPLKAPIVTDNQQPNTTESDNSKSSPPNSAKKPENCPQPTCIPPSGTIPFHRQVMFAAPLCYMFSTAEDAYFLFREMYANYWCRLHTISSRPNTIMWLSCMFESLVQQRGPEVFFHCVQHGIPPLTIAFPWMFSAFSGHLEVDQVLLLWDRIVGYDSLELLAVLSAAIFLFRAKSVLKCESRQEIQDVFSDFRNLKVVPLLQYSLFSGTRD